MNRSKDSFHGLGSRPPEDICVQREQSNGDTRFGDHPGQRVSWCQGHRDAASRLLFPALAPLGLVPLRAPFFRGPQPQVSLRHTCPGQWRRGRLQSQVLEDLRARWSRHPKRGSPLRVSHQPDDWARPDSPTGAPGGFTGSSGTDHSTPTTESSGATRIRGASMYVSVPGYTTVNSARPPGNLSLYHSDFQVGESGLKPADRIVASGPL